MKTIKNKEEVELCHTLMEYSLVKNDLHDYTKQQRQEVQNAFLILFDMEIVSAALELAQKEHE